MKREPDYKKALTAHTKAVIQFLASLDEEMRQPSTPERGKRIAKISNALEMANDKVRYFVLGVDYRTDNKGRAKAADRGAG